MITSIATSPYPAQQHAPHSASKPEAQEALKHQDHATKESEETNSATLSEEKQREVEQLKTIDREVRAHEAAHQAAAGQYARGGASYSYQKGPDGVNYAVGGEVQIDTSAIAGDPEATLRKAETIRAAALAPAEPSSQDISVAAKASQMAAQARAEVLSQQGNSTEAKVAAYQNTENKTGQLLNTFA